MNKKKILNEIEKIQKFIEENDSKDSHGQSISDFDKLCLVQQDLTKLQEHIKKPESTVSTGESK